MHYKNNLQTDKNDPEENPQINTNNGLVKLNDVK